MNSLKNRSILGLSVLISALLSLTLIPGCGDRTLDIQVSLVTESCPDRDGQVTSALTSVQFLEFVVSGDGLSKPYAAYASVGEGKAVITDVPLAGTGGDVRRRIDVYARATTIEGPIVARGAAVVDVEEGVRTVSVPIFLRQVDRFGFTASAANPQTCTTMNRSRSGHTATVLRDGRVLIVGGAILEGDERIVVSSAEIYDPSTGEFTMLEGESGPRQPRVFHTATLLRDGRVLVAGGEYDPPNGGGAQANKSAEIFDPGTDSFLSPIVLPRERTRHTATAVAGDMVLLAGGYSDPNPPPGKSHPVPTATIDIFHAAGGGARFSEGADLPAPRAEHCSVTVADGTRVVLAGGKTLAGSEVAVASSLRYLRVWPDEERLTPIQDAYSMRTGRYALGCGVTRNTSGGEQIVLAGGFRRLDGFGDDSAFAGVELFDPGSSTPSQDLGSLPNGARGDICVAQVEGDMLFIGGFRDGAPAASASVDRLWRDQTGPELETVRGQMIDKRYYHQCTVLRDGAVLVTGGQYEEVAEIGDPLSLTTAEILTPLRRD